MILLSKMELLDRSLGKLREPFERTGLVRKQIQVGGSISGDLDGAIVNAIIDPVRSDVKPLC